MGKEPLDAELRELALLALRSSFWQRFSELCNDYIAAAEGLGDLDDFIAQLGEKTSIYGRGEGRGLGLNLDVRLGALGPRWGEYPATMLNPLLDPEVHDIYLDGRRVFTRVKGEWVWAAPW